jgi:hypothetical protein
MRINNHFDQNVKRIRQRKRDRVRKREEKRDRRTNGEETEAEKGGDRERE